ncbi:MAG: cytochrome b/b6 domain-containing protein [Pseudomonadota bacterium]
MGRSASLRYSDAAIVLHWLIAASILGLLAVGKFMVSLEADDPLRFELTQWHKTFGLLVLGLSVLRLLWRATHAPPAIDYVAPAWQHRAASATHIGLYALTFLIPVTGWIMVSASPLNIDTLLFGVLEVPHLPPFDTLPNRDEIAEHFAGYHELASHALIVLLLMHAGAALKHHLIEKDGVLLRMLPDTASASFRRTLGGTGLIAVAAGTALYAYAVVFKASPVLAAGATEVSFTALVTQSETPGVFTDSKVEAALDFSNPAASQLSARVQTATVQSNNPQVQNQLPEPDWFDAGTHPEATFVSTAIEAAGPDSLVVTGTLTLKGTAQPVSFVLNLADEDDVRVARGSFDIDRRDFDIGMRSQADEEYVGFTVTIHFQFEIDTGEP